ncbi:hypothetical protein C8A01DRAFT_32747 [Parachaetomium inaequale]|uniref:Zn(2)-C6 fungal-type domain-containing protein n=1 Tax=Parachaetomium inaequale TaxID=2588326 RepID=A0AAN6PNH8_9PEZI|nr:hypothetical protein C8A01DRAFT_32747 [Parachaetomium inaequale]
MESRGPSSRLPSHVARWVPAVPGESRDPDRCDQCRARKIGGERASPCANCVSGKVRCTYSAVVSSTATSKQRVLISAPGSSESLTTALTSSMPSRTTYAYMLRTVSEQKIDSTAKDIDRIKQLLDGLSFSSPGTEPRWDHSSHIIDFVKTVIQNRGTREVGAGEAEVLSSLRGLVKTLDSPAAGYKATRCREDNYSMSPLEAAVAVLRWAKAHKGYTRIKCISQSVPLERFTDICQKVYFAVEDYREVDVIVANRYLSYLFFEHDVATGLKGFRDYHRVCRQNLSNTVLQLPLFLPPSVEAIAALTLGALHAIEDSKGGLAWPLISTASELCQTLGYHRLPSSNDENQPPSRTAAQELYSPAGLLSRPDGERRVLAGGLAREMRKLLDKRRAEVLSTQKSSDDDDDGDNADPLRVLYLNFDLVCQSSMLALILNTPFVPFSILFTRAIQRLDAAELAPLDRFTASLRPAVGAPESTTTSTHPYRLYKLLFQAARLYFDVNGPGPAGDNPTLMLTRDPDFLGVGAWDFGHGGVEAVVGAHETAGQYGGQTQQLSDWFYGNQQLMASSSWRC